MKTTKMALIQIDKCDRHKECLAERVCIANAIQRDEEGLMYVDTECTGCGKCIIVCSKKAIIMI